MTTTAKLALPMMAAAQAQKEWTHNEALGLIDAAVQPVAAAMGRNRPPDAAAPGEAWVIGRAPTDAWAGHADALATWTAGGWRFVAPWDGMAVWLADRAVAARFTGGGWRIGIVQARTIEIDGVQVVGARGGAIADPVGGATVDAQARAALFSVLTAMRTHGLIAA